MVSEPHRSFTASQHNSKDHLKFCNAFARRPPTTPGDGARSVKILVPSMSPYGSNGYGSSAKAGPAGISLTPPSTGGRRARTLAVAITLAAIGGAAILAKSAADSATASTLLSAATSLDPSGVGLTFSVESKQYGAAIPGDGHYPFEHIAEV